MAPPGPPLSEDDAAAAQTLATSMHRRRGSHWGKVGMDLDLWKVGLCREEVGQYKDIKKTKNKTTDVKNITRILFCVQSTVPFFLEGIVSHFGS